MWVREPRARGSAHLRLLRKARTAPTLIANPNLRARFRAGGSGAASSSDSDIDGVCEGSMNTSMCCHAESQAAPARHHEFRANSQGSLPPAGAKFRRRRQRTG
eukprot:2180323-Alexandrium_andersonii.AAC.1